MGDQGFIVRFFVGFASLFFFNAWYFSALGFSLGWNALWTAWLAVKVYLDIGIEIAAIILGQDIATYLVYITNGVLLISIMANTFILSISLASIAMMFWVDNGEFIIATVTYWYDQAVAFYNWIISEYLRIEAIVLDYWNRFV